MRCGNATCTYNPAQCNLANSRQDSSATAVGTSGWSSGFSDEHRSVQQAGVSAGKVYHCCTYLPSVSACCAKFPLDTSKRWPSRRRRMASTLRRGSDMKSSRLMSKGGGSRYNPGGVRVSMPCLCYESRASFVVCVLVESGRGFPKHRIWRFYIFGPIMFRGGGFGGIPDPGQRPRPTPDGPVPRSKDKSGVHLCLVVSIRNVDTGGGADTGSHNVQRTSQISHTRYLYYSVCTKKRPC